MRRGNVQLEATQTNFSVKKTNQFKIYFKYIKIPKNDIPQTFPNVYKYICIYAFPHSLDLTSY